MNKKQALLGVIVILAALVLGALYLNGGNLYFRLLMGMGLGYALTRSFMGFAGSVNRAYRGGSTRLMQVLMGMFVVTAIINAGFLLNGDPKLFDLWVNPINAGLILGGLFFGFGMSFSSCCASGVMTDLVTDIPRAGVTLIFFCAGVYLGFPLQASQSWISRSWFTSASYPHMGVFMPDLFSGGPLKGYLGAILLTVLFAGITVILARKYEDYRRRTGQWSGVDSEKEQDRAHDVKRPQSFHLLSADTWHAMFVRPWSMTAGAAMIVVIFTLMLAATKSGWGASTPFGIWFGQVLIAFGVSPDSVAHFAAQPAAMYLKPFFHNEISVQNFGIMVGTLGCALLAGQMTMPGRYNLKQLACFALGGLAMGLGTRFANGCNVGALYTPIANLSLSGWVFFVALVGGGMIGNTVAKKLA